jgi:predicted Zn-dependent protease
MIALALHELGHALGLNHSPDRRDVMYPETSADDLTLRDRRTALLLYSLPPGDLK